MPDSKLFLGPRLRRLRRERGLTQTDMAQSLGISPSYLNHIERNQRPLTAPVLLRLAQHYEIDVRAFAASGSARTTTEHLVEIFADDLFADLAVPRYELAELAANAPAIADAIARLYAARQEATQTPATQGNGDARTLVTPETWVRDYIQEHANHFPALEECAERIGGALFDGLSIVDPLRRRLKEAWGVEVRIGSDAELEGMTQRFDRDRRTLMLSASLHPENRSFALAYQLARIEFRGEIDRLVQDARPPEGVDHLLAMSLANYAAGAIMMPYGRFLASAEACRYAIDRLCGEYGANVEQVAHRLTMMGRSGARGVPFFMLRVDPAGNVSKRYAGENFPFSRLGGTCPRWNLHAAFQSAGQVMSQVIETPDGERYFTLARTIERPIRTDASGAGLLAIGLGCELKYAHRLQAADGIDLGDPPVTPVGPACTICPRANCAHRANAPAGRRLAVQEDQKTISPYPFIA